MFLLEWPLVIVGSGRASRFPRSQGATPTTKSCPLEFFTPEIAKNYRVLSLKRERVAENRCTLFVRGFDKALEIVPVQV